MKNEEKILRIDIKIGKQFLNGAKERGNKRLTEIFTLRLEEKENKLKEYLKGAK